MEFNNGLHAGERDSLRKDTVTRINSAIHTVCTSKALITLDILKPNENAHAAHPACTPLRSFFAGLEEGYFFHVSTKLMIVASAKLKKRVPSLHSVLRDLVRC